MQALTLERRAPAQALGGPLVLLILDGVGLGPDYPGNAVLRARKPTLDALMATQPWIPLRAHGEAVGLPSDDDMGNSEVGHNALGAGRVFAQGAKLVNAAIESGALFAGPVWQEQVRNCREQGTPLHFIGLLSDGNVHSHIDQLCALLRAADEAGVAEAYVHVLLDGRDVPETSGLVYVDQLEAVLRAIEARGGRRYRIASGGGRMKVTMDRYEADWSVVQRGWEAHVRGEARRFPSARAAIETFRAEEPGAVDQYLPAFVVEEDGAPVGPIRDGASVIFFNFRGDRAIEISRAFTEEGLATFERGPLPKVLYAGMMQYDGDLAIPPRYLVTPPAIDRTVSEYLAAAGLRQYAISETQKFGHVTYFWNGNRSGMFDPATERYEEIPSDRVPFDERPWMKAAEIVDAVIAQLESPQPPDFLRLNLANGDMVGHSGKLEAATVAMECVDLCVERLLKAAQAAGAAVLVTADHGNADEMWEYDKKKGRAKVDAAGRPLPRTAHSLNPVPFVLVEPAGAPRRFDLRRDLPAAGLGNVAATLLDLLGFLPPDDYLPSLLQRV